MLGSAWRWTVCITLASGLEVAAWSGLRRIPALAGNPGGASALALCWIQAFVLPPLFARPWPGLPRLLLSAATGILASLLAVAVGFLAGLQVGSLAIMTVLAFGGTYDGSAVYDPPGPLLRAVEDILGDVMLWSDPAAGAAVAAITAVGLALLLPATRHPRVSWWVAAAGFQAKG